MAFNEEEGSSDDPIRKKTPVIYSVLAAFVKPFVGFPKCSFFHWVLDFPDEAVQETEKWNKILESLRADLAATSKGLDQSIHFIGKQKEIDEDTRDHVRKKIFRNGESFDVQGNELILYCRRRSYPPKNDIERYQELWRRCMRFPSVEVEEDRKSYEQIRFIGKDRVITDEMKMHIQEKIFPENARFEVDENKIMYDPFHRADLCRGDRVEAKLDEWDKYYPGEITGEFIVSWTLEFHDMDQSTFDLIKHSLEAVVADLARVDHSEVELTFTPGIDRRRLSESMVEVKLPVHDEDKWTPIMTAFANADVKSITTALTSKLSADSVTAKFDLHEEEIPVEELFDLQEVGIPVEEHVNRDTYEIKFDGWKKIQVDSDCVNPEVEFIGNYPSQEQIESYRESLIRVTEYYEMEVVQNNYRLLRANQGMILLLEMAQEAIQELINMAKSFLGLIKDDLEPERAIQHYWRRFYIALMDMKDECVIMLDEEDHSINSQLVLVGLICACQCMERPQATQFMERKIFCVKMVKKYFLKTRKGHRIRTTCGVLNMEKFQKEAWEAPKKYKEARRKYNEAQKKKKEKARGTEKADGKNEEKRPLSNAKRKELASIELLIEAMGKLTPKLKGLLKINLLADDDDESGDIWEVFNKEFEKPAEPISAKKELPPRGKKVVIDSDKDSDEPSEPVPSKKTDVIIRVHPNLVSTVLSTLAQMNITAIDLEKDILEAVQQVLNPEDPSDFDHSIYSEFVAFYRLIFNMFEYECVFPGGEYTHECKFFNQTFKINHYFIYRLYTGKYLDEHLDDITELKLCYIDYLKKDCLVTSSLDRTVVIWDDEGHRLRTFTHNSGVTCFDISDDGKLLVAGCADFTLVKTPLRKKKPRISIMRGHTGSIRGVVITQSKNYIYSISSDCCVCQWDNGEKDSQNSERAQREPKINWLGQHRDTPTCIVAIGSSDDVITASNDCLLKVWEGATGEAHVLDSHTDYVSFAKVCPTTNAKNGRFLVSCSWDNSSKIWDINSERQKTVLRHTLDGHMVEDQSMPRGYRETNGHSKHVTWCDIHQSGRFLITASNDATVKLWELEDGLFLKTFKGHTSAVVHCVFINKGWWFASCSNDHTVRIWDWQNGNCVTILRGHFGPVLSCIETPWGLVSRGNDKSLRVWQLEQFYHYRYHFPGKGDGINHSHGHERQKALIVKARRESTATAKSTRANKQFGFAENIEESKTFDSSDKVGSAPKSRSNSGIFE